MKIKLLTAICLIFILLCTGCMKEDDPSSKPRITTRFMPTEVVNTPSVTPDVLRVQDLKVSFREYERVKLYTASGDQFAMEVNDIFAVGFKFTASKNLVGLVMNCPSYHDNKGYMVFKIYQWDTDYDTTIAKEPLDSASIKDYRDNTDVPVKFPKSLPPDTYLFTLSDGADMVGIWLQKPLEGSTVFYAGVETEGALVVDAVYEK